MGLGTFPVLMFLIMLFIYLVLLLLFCKLIIQFACMLFFILILLPCMLFFILILLRRIVLVLLSHEVPSLGISYKQSAIFLAQSITRIGRSKQTATKPVHVVAIVCRM